jgi:ankyrin repeat protein
MNSTMALNNELLAAASAGNIGEIDRLISLGANPNFRDVLDGGTCLHHAVGKGDIVATRRLLGFGSDPNIVTQNTSTSPLGVAALAGNEAMVELLLTFGARLSELEVLTELLSECRELNYNKIVNMIELSHGIN